MDVPIKEIMNATPLLIEIRHALRVLHERGETKTLNLSNFPLTNGDSRFLDEALGRGNVTISYRGREHTYWQETKIAGVWWGEYRNSNGHVVLRTIEITDFPELAKSQSEDVEEGLGRLEEIIGHQLPPVARQLPVLNVMSGEFF